MRLLASYPTLTVLLATSAYALCCLLLPALPFNTTLVPLYAVLTVPLGLYPGVFFAPGSEIYGAGVLFFRKNNDFIVGLAIGMLLFTLFGRLASWIPPVLLIVLYRLPNHPLRSVSAP